MDTRFRATRIILLVVFTSFTFFPSTLPAGTADAKQAARSVQTAKAAYHEAEAAKADAVADLSEAEADMLDAEAALMLAEIGKKPNEVKKLHNILKAWRKETGAPVPSQLNPDYRP